MIGSSDTFAKRLTSWYRKARRDLPWRRARPDPYHVLVSETMLQQTQVATVIPYFLRFIKEFPAIRQLALADEQRVLRLWQGLGYYSRARNLLAAARVIVREFEGKLPKNPHQLLKLPGVGRYTAGAIASLAYDRRAPIVDGNVSRVLCRIDRIEAGPTQLWRRAEEVLPSSHVGDFNSALMELGATVCTAKSPKCSICPVRAHCEAFAGGVQHRIPRPRASKPAPLLRRRTWCIRRTRGAAQQWLIEQRPPIGRWAGLWQFITRPVSSKSSPARVNGHQRLGAITHALSHRRYRFDIYVCDGRSGYSALVTPGFSVQRKWVQLEELDRYPLPRPQHRIAQMLAGSIARN